ncbi:hypothetical protein A6A19_06000 [Actinobacillus delphinicola]|uniref:Iron-sulfur cluster repair di-iron protein n=1 Tax=Actinobacillus delphinicola TaxID=51161 RepID=A0A448TTC1_9PAST|nr:hemerythrin domain-containing protein [Actinobacillus delphinicola]MDG6897544.1 hypothetical protein [Actinobacillus delphinicola]VEJ09232.1 iron-sulfur cluster repair di-iron protein [Actinobacillus delphinicola]
MQSLAQSTRNAAILDTDALIQYIIDRHHQRERFILTQLEDTILQACEKYPDNALLLSFYQKFIVAHQELLNHFESEEQDLYPKILHGEKVNWDKLTKEHIILAQSVQQLSELLTKIKLENNKISSDLVNKMVENFENFAVDVHHHMFLENMVLFKR